MRRHRGEYTIFPYDQPKLVIELAIRVMAAEIADVTRRSGDDLGSEHPHMIAVASRIIVSDTDNTRERDWRDQAMIVAWSCYRRLKEMGIIGDEFDKQLFR